MTSDQAGEVLGLEAGTVRRWARGGRFAGATRFEDGSHAIPISAVLAEQEASRLAAEFERADEAFGVERCRRLEEWADALAARALADAP